MNVCICIENGCFWLQLQEYKSKMQETQTDLQRQLQASKKVSGIDFVLKQIDV